MKTLCTTTVITVTMAILLAGVAAPVFAGALPTWDNTFPAALRFKVLANFNGEAVLDRETGLVWQRSPSTSLFLYVDARHECDRLIVGGPSRVSPGFSRMGWRLPKIHELTSLIDPNVAGPVFLPAGHPFLNVGQFQYWSGSLKQFYPGISARVMQISEPVNNFVFSANIDPASNVVEHVWCVRAPGNAIESSEQ
jgi:hypothetical protein